MNTDLLNVILRIRAQSVDQIGERHPIADEEHRNIVACTCHTKAECDWRLHSTHVTESGNAHILR